MSAQHPLVTQLVSALRLARGYMSDAVEYEMPCAKRDATTVDDAIAAASIAPMLAAQGEQATKCTNEQIAKCDCPLARYGRCVNDRPNPIVKAAQAACDTWNAYQHSERENLMLLKRHWEAMDVLSDQLGRL